MCCVTGFPARNSSRAHGGASGRSCDEVGGEGRRLTTRRSRAGAQPPAHSGDEGRHRYRHAGRGRGGRSARGLSIEMAHLSGVIAAHVDALDCALRHDLSLVEDLVTRVLSEKLMRAGYLVARPLVDGVWAWGSAPSFNPLPARRARAPRDFLVPVNPFRPALVGKASVQKYPREFRRERTMVRHSATSAHPGRVRVRRWARP